MQSIPRQALLIPAAVALTACWFPRTPVLPARLDGPLGASADSLIASTQPRYCAPARHLDFGTTPQGCVRAAGDVESWVNWKGPGRVVKIGREWTRPDLATALGFADSLETDLRASSGAPVECHYDLPYSAAREVRWIAPAADSITTVLKVIEQPNHIDVPDMVLGSSLRGLLLGSPPRTNPAAPAHVLLLRVLGPERCGKHVDRPWSH